MNDRRILVTGSRTWTDHQTIYDVLVKEFAELTVLIHGDANGADQIARDIWLGLGGIDESHPPNYELYGRPAPLIRNTEMASLGADICHAFRIGNSRGTAHMISQCKKFGIETLEH